MDAYQSSRWYVLLLIGWTMIWIIMIIGVLTCCGCHRGISSIPNQSGSPPSVGSSPSLPPSNTIILNHHTIPAWPVWLGAIGMAVSAAVILLMPGPLAKFGVAGFIVSFLSVVAMYVLVRFASILSIIGLIAAIVILIYTSLIRTRVDRDLIKTVETIKPYISLHDKDVLFDTVIKGMQHEITRQVVKSVKKGL